MTIYLFFKKRVDEKNVDFSLVQVESVTEFLCYIKRLLIGYVNMDMAGITLVALISIFIARLRSTSDLSIVETLRKRYKVNLVKDVKYRKS